jgi:hypothetical protein
MVGTAVPGTAVPLALAQAASMNGLVIGKVLAASQPAARPAARGQNTYTSHGRSEYPSGVKSYEI